MFSATKALKEYVMDCYLSFVDDNRGNSFVRKSDREAVERKKSVLQKRDAEIVKNIVDGYIISEQTYGNRSIMDYGVVLQHVIRQQGRLYMEEQLQERRAVMENGEVIDDYLLHLDGNLKNENWQHPKLNTDYGMRQNVPYSYNRLEVVKYAERWWNSYNPAYRHFHVDCTNFVSQCMRAGGAPMTGQPDRSRGWWYAGRNDQWSYSWAVAHSLRWYLSGSNKGLQAKEVATPEELLRGDVICYDFDGDGHWQHNTIVVAKDAYNMPLVNAHTTNSRMRYWSYEDSTAWTENIKYKFFHILG